MFLSKTQLSNSSAFGFPHLGSRRDSLGQGTTVWDCPTKSNLLPDRADVGTRIFYAAIRFTFDGCARYSFEGER